jgi:flagellar protein FlaG
MRVELLFPDVSTTPARAGPTQRQGIKGVENQQPKGTEEKPPSRTSASSHFQTEDTAKSKGNPTSPVPTQEKEKVPTQETIESLVNGLQVRLEFAQDKDTGRNMIKVYDRKSGDLVRQIPPKEVMDFLHQIKEGKGVLISQRL